MKQKKNYSLPFFIEKKKMQSVGKLIFIFSLLFSVLLSQLPSSSITGNLGNIPFATIGAAIYSPSQDIYCVGGSDLNCYDASNDQLIVSHPIGGIIFWMQGYENNPSPGVAGLIFCRQNGGNSGVYTLDLTRINNPPRRRVDLNENLSECAVDFASNRFMFSVASGNNFFDISTQVNMDQLDPNVDGAWSSGLIDYTVSGGRANREGNSNAVLRGIGANPRYFWTENTDDIFIFEQNTENQQLIEYIDGVDLLSLAADDTDPDNVFLWMGTDIGLVWKINIATGAIADVVIAIGYQITEIHIDTVNSVLFFAGRSVNGGVGRWFRANFDDTSSTLVDFMDIPTTEVIQAAALDTVNQRMWIIADNGDRYRVDFSNCGAFGDSCTECLADPVYCNWCYDAGSCEPTGACTNPLGSSALAETDPMNCPAIENINPVTGLPGTNIAVSLSNNAARPGLNLECRFDGNDPVPGTLSNGNTVLNCPAPSRTGSASLTVNYQFDNSPFAAGSQTFAFISCSANTDCNSCAINPGCSWCLDDLTCFETGIGMCSTTSISTSGSCPVFNRLMPETNPANSAFSTTISSGPFVDNGGTYELILEPGSIAVPVSFVSTTQLTASVPALPADTYTATLQRGGQDYFQSVTQQLEIFDCSGISECGECTDPDINCIWCTEDRACRNPSDSCSSGGLTNDGQCPFLISLNPPSEFNSGSPNPLTIITSGLLPSSPNYQCSFGGSTVMATVNGNTITCDSIPAGTGLVPLDVLVDSNPTPVISSSFLYFDCSTFADCDSCLDPVLNGDCEFCFESGMCGDTGTVMCNSATLSTCGAVTTVSPAGVDVDASEMITFTLNTVPDIAMGYECVWTTPNAGPTIEMTPATRLSATTLRCNSPQGDISLIGSPPDPTFYEATVDIQSVSTGLVLASTSLTIFDCPLIGTNDCTTCSSLPFCGLCLGPNVCSSLSECLLSGSNVDLWLDGTLGCPTISDISPDHASMTGGNDISVTGSLFLVDGIQCQFGSTRTPATRVSNSQLSCTAPASTTPDAQLSLVQASITYSDNSADFLFVDCTAFTDCESCTADTSFGGRCGWCLTTASCGPVFECPQGDWEESLCPSITGITPGFSEFGSSTDFELSGTLFRPGVEVFFGEVPASQVAVQSDSLITGTSPAFEDDGASNSVQVRLMINGASYASAFVSFNLIPASSSENGNVAAAVGATLGVLCLFICCAVCIIWLLYTRFKNIMSRRTVKVVEPKWDVLAYSNWLVPLYKNKNPREYESLVNLLTRSPLSLLLAAKEVTQATEQDPLARAATYIFLEHADLCTSMIFLIKTEIKQAVHLPETLFRSNSLTTKIFKYYAKIIGTRYLFKMLARYVAEMELSRKLQQEDMTELNTLADMELDPHKMEQANDELQIQENKTNLLSFSQKILNTILRSTNEIPPQILKIILTIRDSVQEQFNDPELTFKSIGAFFFLRFICPAIAAPESYFRDDPPDDYVRRQLVLLSKMIQNLANNVQFGGKEQFMAPLNPFITDNAENLKRFYEKLNKVDTSSGHDVDVPSEALSNAYSWTHNHFSLLNSPIQSELGKTDVYEDGPQIATQFQNVMDELGAPPEKLKKGK